MNDQIKIKELAELIEYTRIKLNRLICDKGYDLLNPDIIELSHILDELLSKYHNLK